ncbi:MAG: sugar-binding protein [Rikenellaceae bacterium]
MIKINFILTAIAWVLCIADIYSQEFDSGYKLDPPRYVCYKSDKNIKIDGQIYNDEWDNAPWSNQFIDIRGEEFEKKPIYSTRMKMLWDEANLYIAAELIEPHIWATLTERDATIYFDNDFEVFIDPDGDTHNYFEFEINAFGTEWDLLMTKPYIFGGTYINGYQMVGLETSVKHYGTINDPSDQDDKWVVEMKIPFSALVNRKVNAGESWRMNFSRVEWLSVTTDGNKYQKVKGKEGFGNEENWVWAATGVVDIHRPEYWGFVQFSPSNKPLTSDDFTFNKEEECKFALRKLLNIQNSYYAKNGRFASELSEFNLTDEHDLSTYSPQFHIANNYIIISATSSKGDIWQIASDGRVWKSR